MEVNKRTEVFYEIKDKYRGHTIEIQREATAIDHVCIPAFIRRLLMDYKDMIIKINKIEGD